MKRRVSIILSFILIMVMATPALASVNLEVNGKAFEPAQQPYLENGVTAVALDVITNTLGCQTTVEGEVITLKENDRLLKMAIGSTKAVINGDERLMPIAPRVINGQTFVPLRFVYEALGASISWNGENNTIGVTYRETRQDMTAEELMAQASEKMMQAGRYKMDVDIQSAMDMTVLETGQDPQKMNMDMNADMEAWVQMDPVVMYMKQTATMDAPSAPKPGSQSMQTEMVLNEDGIFMTMPEVGWVKMNLEGVDLQDLMKQSMTQDPAAAMKLMQDMGMSMSFAEDQEKNGKKYWVLHVIMGGEIFQSDYFKQFSQQMPALEKDLDMQKVFDNMDLNFVYDMWVDQSTFYTDYMNLDGTMAYNMDLPATASNSGGSIDMSMDLKASYALSGYGQEFTTPEIQDARDFEEVLKEQAAKVQEQAQE